MLGVYFVQSYWTIRSGQVILRVPYMLCELIIRSVCIRECLLQDACAFRCLPDTLLLLRCLLVQGCQLLGPTYSYVSLHK